jgi:hypothetical protein
MPTRRFPFWYHLTHHSFSESDSRTESDRVGPKSDFSESDCRTPLKGSD